MSSYCFRGRMLWAATVLMLFATGRTATAGDKVTVGRRVRASDRVAMQSISHDVWNALLQKYVDARGWVDYRGWKRNSGDLRRLDAYLATLSTADPSRSTREATLAFWINAYNAVTIRGILREYPTTSIRNHTARLWGYNIWKDLLLPVAGRDYSLNDIEHKVLRPMGEKRVHFAIVCASVGCPRLRNEAYTAERLESQLADNTRDFFSRRQNFYVEPARRTVHVSSILKWFAEDFGPTPQAGLQGLLDYITDPAAHRLVESGNFRVVYLDYDWSLNDQARRRTAKR